MVRAKNKLVCGVGKNDANYKVYQKDENGKVVKCPFYSAWSKMLVRCYSDKTLIRQPTYAGCHVCEDWLTFSNFKSWMQSQDWKGKQLDKDIIFKGNKLYSPHTCCFVSQSLNLFLMDCGSAKGNFPTGVSWRPTEKKYSSTIQNPFLRKSEFLGCFKCPEDAHEQWRKKKHQFACEYAKTEKDPRVSAALRSRFKKQEGVAV